MGAESRLRQRHRAVIRAEYPHALIVSQPADGFTGPGRPDLYVVVEGRYVGLELKTSTGRTTDIQLQNIARTRHSGGWAWVVRSPEDSLGAIRAALRGVRMPEHTGIDFDALFGEASSSIEEKPAGMSEEEIQAFLTTLPTERATEEPDGDYSMAEVTSLIREVAISVAQLHLKVDAIMSAAGVDYPAQPAVPESPTPQGPPPSKSPRRRRS